MRPIVLRLEHLSKTYGSVTAVEDLSLTVQAGECFGFLGPNGAGKTTTISMILGLVHPTAGRVEVLGQRVTPAHPAPLREVGALVGTPGFYPYLTGRDNLRLLAHLYPQADNLQERTGASSASVSPASQGEKGKMRWWFWRLRRQNHHLLSSFFPFQGRLSASKVDERRVEEVLDMVGLRAAADRKVKTYSTGMRQRLGLAAALLHRPRLLVLDEPTNGLDPVGMAEMRALLRRLTEQGTTVFLSSHLLHEVQQVCDRVVILNRGRLVAQGPVSDLLTGRRDLEEVFLDAVQSYRAPVATLS